MRRSGQSFGGVFGGVVVGAEKPDDLSADFRVADLDLLHVEYGREFRCLSDTVGLGGEAVGLPAEAFKQDAGCPAFA